MPKPPLVQDLLLLRLLPLSSLPMPLLSFVLLLRLLLELLALSLQSFPGGTVATANATILVNFGGARGGVGAAVATAPRPTVSAAAGAGAETSAIAAQPAAMNSIVSSKGWFDKCLGVWRPSLRKGQ